MSNEKITTAIATLFANEMTEQGLAELHKRFPVDVVHDMTDSVQFQAARKDRTERNKIVKAINERRISVTGQLKTKGDDLVNDVELIFAPVVGPFEEQLEVNKLAKEKAERELKALLDGQRIEISNMNNFVTECIGKTSQSISDVIEAVDLVDTSYFHKDIIHEAIETKKTVCARLAELLSLAINEESLALERARLAEQKELAEKAQLIIDLKAKAQERLNNLMMIPTGFFGKSSNEINDKIESLKNYEALESEFGELFKQANATKQQVISQLETMASQQEMVEKSQAEQQAKSEQEKVIEDAVATGTGFSQGGKRIAPEDVYQEPKEHSMAETMAKNAPTLSGSVTKTFKVQVEWSGYSRGYSVYEVEAESEEQAKEMYYEGNRIEREVVRDDTETAEVNIIN
jgi:hypothetical protein